METTALEHNKTNKYFGINDMNGINHTINEEKIRKEFYKRIRVILRTELNAKYKVIAISVVTYSFDIILFTQPLRSGRIWHKVNF